MKRFLSPSLLLATAALLFAQTSQLSGGDTNLGGWGTLTDPDGDCSTTVAGDTLTIRVPGSSRPHDLAPDLNTINAPRVLKPMAGDFKRAVRIAGTFDPGTESTQPTRFGFNGAGLVAMVDERNYFVVFHGVYQRPGEKEPVSYVNFALCVNGKPQDLGQRLVPQNSSVALGLARNGTKMSAAMSADGKDVAQIGAVEMPAGWPSALRVGVVAISTAKREFSPQFTEPGNGAGAPPAATSPPALTVATRHFNIDRNQLGHFRTIKFVEFSFDYPSTWTVRQGAQTKNANNFAEVINPASTASIDIGSFRSNNGGSAAAGLPVAGPMIGAQIEASLKQGLAGYRKISEGPTRLNGYAAYEIRASGSTASGVAAWARVIFMAPSDNTPNGLIVGITVTAQETSVRGIDDVGTKGDLGTIIGSLRFSR